MIYPPPYKWHGKTGQHLKLSENALESVSPMSSKWCEQNSNLVLSNFGEREWMVVSPNTVHCAPQKWDFPMMWSPTTGVQIVKPSLFIRLKLIWAAIQDVVVLAHASSMPMAFVGAVKNGMEKRCAFPISKKRTKISSINPQKIQILMSQLRLRKSLNNEAYFLNFVKK